MQAPVGSAATPRLAGEVSRAGGLGSLGASWTEPAVLREQVRWIVRVTDRPFCVNLVLDFEQHERLELAVEEQVPIVSFSFGLRPDLVARARAALAAGAVAVVMGTRFVASAESAAHEGYKQDAADRSSGSGHGADRIVRRGWPQSPHRVLRNSTYERREAAGWPPSGERPGEGDEVSSGVLRYASNLPSTSTEGDVEAMAMHAGQSVGSISAVEPAAAAAILERFGAALRRD